MSKSPDISKNRVIKKSRVIAGLLGEIDAAGVLVFFQPESKNASIAARIQSEFKIPFESSILRIIDSTMKPGTYQASALFAGQRITFSVEVTDDSGLCKLPSEVLISDLRSQKRRRFGPEIEHAEIFTKHGVIMATPIDMSQNSIALFMNSTEGSLTPGESVRLVIRGDTTSQDIFTANLQVKEFLVVAKQSKILLAPKDPRDDIRGQGLLRLVPRHAMTHMTFLISPLDDHLGEPINCLISDVSLTGFQCVIPGIEAVPWAMPGVHVSIRSMGVTATIIWKDAEQCGFRINGIDHSTILSEWSNILAKFKIGHGFHHTQVDELVNLFTESGLLKGGRRKIYGETLGGFLPPEHVLDNPMLYRRVLAIDANVLMEGHISMARLSEDLWYFQEGSHIGDKTDTYRLLYIKTILLARTMYISSKQAPRYLSGLFHTNIKSAGVFGSELFTDPAARVFLLHQVSMSKTFAKLPTEVLNQKISPLEDLNADERRTALSNFDATLVEGFAGWNGNHPRLNAELSKLGSHHEAKTLLIADEKRVWAMAYRLRSYYALNVTGVMNSLFLIVLPDVSATDIAGALRQLVDNGMAFGTDDVAIIASSKADIELPFVQQLPDPKMFTFFIIDNHLNREFLGAKVESQESTKLRRPSKKS
jgi:hypothetical protein